MNLLYISNEYPPETGNGGIGTYTKYIAEGMAARGHTVAVIAGSACGKENVEYRRDVEIVRIVPLPYALPSHRYAYPLRRFCTRSFPHSLNRFAWSMAVRKKVAELLGDGRFFDIIEAPECGAEGLLISRGMGKRRVIRLHTPWEMIRRLDALPEPWGDRLLLPYLEKRAAKKADAVSAPSHAIAGNLRRQWRLPKVNVIPNPLPVASFNLTGGKNWLYSGRIERRKGVHHLIAAYTRVVRDTDNAPDLKIIGRAYGTDLHGREYGAGIRTMIERDGIGTKVVWIENAQLDDVASYLQDTAVAFFPSLWENFPYTCLEAMSSGCAVVATECGGFPEIIDHNENGLLVDPDSEEGLENAMRYLLEHPECVAILGRAARKRAAELVSSDRICRDMELFYRNLLEK